MSLLTRLSFPQKRIAARSIRAFLLLVTFSGGALAYLHSSWRPLGFLHYSLGLSVLAALYWLSYRLEKNPPVRRGGLVFAGVFLALATGCLAEFGPGYFAPWKISRDPLYGQIAHQPRLEYGVSRILEKKCSSCHNNDFAAHGFNAVSLASLAGKGEFNDPIYPRNLSKSALYRLVSSNGQSDKHMPPLSGVLSGEELEIIRDWILVDGGVKFSDERVLASASAQGHSHWSLRQFEKPQLPPEVDLEQRAGNEIDRFAFKGGRRAQPEESAERLFRRAHVSITGLIPRLDAYRASRGVGFGQQIDRLLASPHFGERFAAFWFDFVGFAQEGSLDKDMPHVAGSDIYKLEVIRAFNRDLGYLDFMRRQLTWNKATDVWNKDPKKNLIAYLPSNQDKPDLGAFQAMNNVFTFSMGVNIDCARCHNHPFIPVSNENYFEQISFFKDPYNLSLAFTLFDKEDLRAPKLLNLMEQAADFGGGNGTQPLAHWITDPKNGAGLLMARIFVNGVWNHMMGRSLLENPQRLYVNREEPEHIALLNWLTHDFLEHGASVKHLIRKISTSALYRMKPTEEVKSLKGNIRLKPEDLRDSLILLADQLQSGPGSAAKDAGNPEVKSVLGPKKLVRSVYLFRTRQESSYLSAYFAFKDRMNPSDVRNEPVTLSEAYFFFSPTVNKFLEKFAIVSGANDLEPSVDRLDDFYRLFWARPMREQEASRWKDHFGNAASKQEAFREFIRVLLMGNEMAFL